MNTIQRHEWRTRLWFLLLVGLLGLLGLLVGYGLTAQAAPEPAGWYAGDMHVHRSCGGSPESLQSLYNRMDTHDLAVISLLADMGNGEVQNPVTDLPLVTGQDASISTPGRIVHWDAEWHWDATYGQYAHQALGGHLVVLGLAEAHQIWEEYTYPILNWARQQNGIAGFAHMQYLGSGIPQSLNCCIPIEYPVEVALGAADFISEDVTGSDSAIQAYYRLLNTGFRPGLAAGTDYPCGVSVLGSLLTYVQVAGGQMTYRNWIEGIKLGRTVISRNGHNEFLDLKVNSTATPGDEIRLPAGGGTVQVQISWTAKQNLSGTIELVHNGVVVASQQASVTASVPANLTTTVNFTKSGWLAARRMGSNSHQLHTAAVFVTVNNKPVRTSVADAEFYVQWMDNLLEKTSPGGEWNSYFPTKLSEAQTRYQTARAIYQQIASEAGATPQPLAIATTSLANGVLGVAYSATLTASGGTTPYTWSITSGSLPAGLTLNTSSGAIIGTPTTVGTYNFTVQVSDTSNPVQTVTKPLSITISATPPVATTIWPSTAVPGTTDSGPDNAVELGVKFRSDVDGSITGIRFYKGNGNTGAHVGSLWDSNGNLLARAAFTNETASGWQQVNFANPVAITANTVYVASYHTNVGHYSENQNYFATTGVDNFPLHALANGISGGNGVFAYGATSTFPNQTWNSTNYWVDVVFQTAGAAPMLTAIAVTPATPSIAVGATQQFTGTGTYADGSMQDVTSQATWTSSNTAVATINANGLATAVAAGTTTISATLSGITSSTGLTVNGAAPTLTSITVTPATPSIAVGATQQFTATGTYSNGSTQNITSQATWISSNPSVATINSAGLATGVGAGSTTISAALSGVTGNAGLTVQAASTATTIWPSTAVPGTTDSGPDNAVELGVKFRSDVDGSITGIRFYKGSGNTGTHVGNLWTSTGTLLASATFTGETASGWQQVNFANPVAITANTIYVASYHTNVGHYSENQNYFAATGFDNPPLHALANGVSGGNGVYAYGSASAFPNQTWNSTNYWVDVVFSSEPQPLSIATTSPPGGTVGVAYSATLVASGGSTPYTWSITSSSLPADLALDGATGAITGTPTAAGTFNFTAQVTDSSGGIASRSLSIVVAQPTTNTGFLAPGANAAVTASAGDNNGFQTTPANAYADDDLFAVDTNSGTGTSTSCTASGKDKHIYHDYGFGLPSGATISGIEVRLDARADSTTGSPRICVQLSGDGGLTWTAAKTTATTLTTAEATYLLGGAADNWGRTWAVADFSNTNFRVRVINVSSNTNRDFSLDWVAVRVTYQ